MPDIEDLINDHLNWVHALAVRQTRDAHLADDITQAVFLILHRKRPHENAQIKLTGWLFRTTVLLSREALRKKIRRDYHEAQAAILRETAMQPTDDTSSQLTTHIDAAVNELPTSSRTLILLRFYRGLSFAQIATHLGLSENAAKKRMARTLEQLQSLLARRGVHPAQDLGAFLALHLTTQSATGLKSTLLSTLAGKTPASPTVLHLCKAATLASAKPILLAAASLVLVTGVGVGITQLPHSPATPPTPSAQTPAPPPPPIKPQPADANLVEYRFLLPDGKPAADATVIAGTSSVTQLSLSDLTITTPPENATQARTDAIGRVRIPRLLKDRHALFVLHPDGYLIERPEKLQRGPDQYLMPWASIEGTLSDASGPLAGRTVRVSSAITYSSSLASAEASATTDSAGHFRISHVVSGETCSIRVDGLPWSRGVQLLPGETLPLSISETGATLTASVDAPESSSFGNYPINFELTCAIREDGSRIEFNRWAQLPLDQRREFLRKAHDDGTWTRYAQDLNQNFAPGKVYAFACMYRNPAFRLANLPPGTWHARIEAAGYDSTYLTDLIVGLDAHLGTQEIDLPIAPGQPALDLGRLKLRPMNHVLVGDVLPPRSLKNLAGEETILPDPNAAMTVVAFVGVQYRPDIPQAMLGQTNGPSDIEFIEVVLGSNEASLRERQAGAVWPQIHVADWDSSELRYELGLRKGGYGLPLLLAFAPDGTLLARARGYASEIPGLLAQARERLADPAKLKAAESNPAPKDRRTFLQASNIPVLAAPEPPAQTDRKASGP